MTCDLWYEKVAVIKKIEVPNWRFDLFSKQSCKKENLSRSIF